MYISKLCLSNRLFSHRRSHIYIYIYVHIFTFSYHIITYRIQLRLEKTTIGVTFGLSTFANTLPTM